MIPPTVPPIPPAPTGAIPAATGSFGAGPQLVAALLAASAKTLFTKVIPGIFQKPSDPGPGEQPHLFEPTTPIPQFFAKTPANIDALRARDPDFGKIIWAPGVEVDVYSGEVGPAPSRVPPPAPAPSPTPTPDPTRYGYADLPPEGGGNGGDMSIMSPVSILGGVGDVLGGLVGTVGGLVRDVAPIASQLLAPGPMIISERQSYPGGTMATYPTAYPGGAPIYAPSVRPAFGIPGVDLAPPGSTPITPGAQGRLPSTVKVDYVTPCGRQSFTVYRKMGRPVLYSGDYASVKRVKRVASKARRRVGGR